ncbi:MAP7 domain-containing protein 3 isoform X2 [Hemicordylus capensis]|uniref:MAP7 domain-containing protein 3 isoform X2 n=1 Tax=Hemicordylus capensis TaxID=884348 RepID=UPI0023047755|nr:MAP7 domain-containing protein 3 isoform X2 [Hemicordylus capensis]
MAEGSSPSSAAAAPASSSLKGLREQMVAAAQALADERRNQSGMSASPVPSAITIKSATKPVIDGSILKSEERQRLARERREEREKLNAVKELQILDKERKAKLQYEKQMEEKQRRLREQKLKEQQRRAAVEEKRKQKIVEEKEHYEAVVHRTLERSQRLDTRQKRWSWGGSVTDSDSKTASKRSTSTANLKQAETVINKRLSSSAALLNSPSKSTTKRSASLNRLNNKAPVNSEQPVPKGVQVEQKGGVEKKRSSSLSRMSNKLQSSELENVQNEEKTARRPQLIPLDSNVISRLLAPTQASLARSKSAASLSADGKDPSESPLCPRSASNSAISSPVHVPKVPVRSRSIDRLKASDPSENVSLESAQKTEGAKSAAGRRAPSPSLSTPRRSPSPANVGKHPSSPAARQKSHPPSPSVLRQRPPSPARVPKPAPIQRPSLTPNVLSITKKKTDTESKPKERAEEAGGKEPGPSSQTSERENAANASKTKEDAGSKAVPGTTTAEEAARILAEKRRLAREQREREDQERVQREEEERIRKEEMAKKALEEQAQLEAALCQLEEERRAEEEEQQKMAEEERIRREQEEQEKLAELLLQREEAEAKAQEEAERQRQERERIMQQNMQERLERKKRIEEIMKRTRKGDQSGAKNDDQSNAEDDGVEEDEELGLEKQDEPEKKNYIDCSLEGSPVVMHSSPLLQDGSKMEPDDVFINGGDQEEVDQRKDGNSVCFTQNIEASPLVKETIIKNSEILHVNEADHPVGFLSNLNGKSSTWSFEEYIDLGVHPKSTRLSSESIADRATQNLKDATTVPTSPKLAFEEESAVNSLIQPIETASVLVVDSCSGR